LSNKQFTNELDRALARPDIDELRKSVDVYCEWSRRHRERGGDDNDWPDGLDLWFEDRDRDRSLALVALAMASSDDEEFLIGVACGLLESTLSHAPAIDKIPLSAEFLERIVVEARRTPRFRWILSAMWTTGMPQHEVKVIADAVAGASCETDPLPPRPFA
jgi:hypothetical protein